MFWAFFLILIYILPLILLAFGLIPSQSEAELIPHTDLTTNTISSSELSDNEFEEEGEEPAENNNLNKINNAGINNNNSNSISAGPPSTTTGTNNSTNNDSDNTSNESNTVDASNEE